MSLDQSADQHYRDRVARVIAHIVAHPLAAHRLEDLAAIAHFSPFHFHRVYSSIAGETVAATVRRVRLALATRLLEQGRQSITQVALEVGYDSPQAFTRAFSQFTGQSPRAFQRDMHRLILDPGAGHADGRTEHTLAVQIVERPAQRLHALRHQGPPSTIPHTQRRLYLQCGQRATHRLGASCGDPQDTGGGFRYYAAVVLPEPLPAADDGLERLDIPAGLYARHTLTGPYTRINAALAAIHTRWLPASGYEPDDRATLEHYLNSPRNAAQADLRTDLLIPIRPTPSL
ncbi:AraC family transcriptional regulator [Acidovorax sp. Root275]|uniref:AraC family transcriptional regulator n=1 Tax=Acidovorax sp. Root275 TaxID=1736508 RepID=UPI000708B88E|nr:AraC family transcriptional regulator [Acidovorax sp. Root275]KRD55239.1 AraC family transcriptional regulator [Acidovorax sp. Root275]